MEKYELDYDSDDMSAGACLMRYNISDDPRPNPLVQRDHEASTFSSAQDKSVPSEEPTSRATDSDRTQESDDDSDDNDDATFHRNLEELRGDVLYDLAGRQSHRNMLEKIALFHPQANFGTKDLTWHLSNAIKSRSYRLDISKGDLRHTLDTTKEANGVAVTTSRGKSEKNSRWVWVLMQETAASRARPRVTSRRKLLRSSIHLLIVIHVSSNTKDPPKTSRMRTKFTTGEPVTTHNGFEYTTKSFPQSSGRITLVGTKLLDIAKNYSYQQIATKISDLRVGNGKILTTSDISRRVCDALEAQAKDKGIPVSGAASELAAARELNGVRARTEHPIDRDAPLVPVYCYCEFTEDDGDMVACDNPDCQREWFHLECTDLDELPEEADAWYCIECRLSDGFKDLAMTEESKRADEPTVDEKKGVSGESFDGKQEDLALMLGVVG